MIYRKKIIIFLFLIETAFIIILHKTQAEVAKPFIPIQKTLQVAVQSYFHDSIGSNLVKNASFEFAKSGHPQSWSWLLNDANADCQIVDDARSGRQAIKLRNRSPKAPHVFGQLLLKEPIPLLPGQRYTISAFIKSSEPGNAWIGGGGKRWRVRLPFKNASEKWQRFENSFIASEEDKTFRLMIVTTSPTSGLIIDDIKLEKGPQATLFFDPSLCTQDVTILNDIPKEVVSATKEVVVSMNIYLRKETSPPPVHIAILSQSEQKHAEGTTDKLQAGLNHLTVNWSSGDDLDTTYTIEFQVGSLKKRFSFELFTPARYTNARKNTLSQMNMLEQGINEANQAQIPVNYPQAAMAVANRFMVIAAKKKNTGHLLDAVKDVEYIGDLCANQLQTLQEVMSGISPAWFIPDPPLDRLKIYDGNFWVDDEPVMLIGAMGWEELEKDLSTYRDYGFNSIGDDYDVYSSFRMLTSENTIDETAIPRLLESWNRLYEMNVAVSYTPHLTKIPDWMLEKYPDIIGGRTLDDLPRWAPSHKQSTRGPGLYGRFFPFAVDSPNLKRMVERYYDSLMSSLNSLPGFQVLWFMNEPSYNSCDEHYLALFRIYLQNKFNNIDKLNEAWNTTFESFQKINCPAKSKKTNNFDWYTFNRNQISEWFEWLSKTVRRYNTDVVLSNKPSAGTLIDPKKSVDLEHEAELLNIPGSDTFRKPNHWCYAYDWSKKSIMLFDFQKSIAPDKPLADHEFHYVHEPNVKAEYVRAAYMHSYLHGLRMSQFWVWATGDFTGNGNSPGLNYTAWSQPQAAWGTASATLNIKRLAKYISLFPQKPEVAIYFSLPSLYVAGEKYSNILTKTYEAANCLDAPIGFATDKMICSGRLKDYKLLIVAGAENIEENTRIEISKFIEKGGIVAITESGLKKNEYGKKYITHINNSNSSNFHVLKFSLQTDHIKRLAVQLDEIFDIAGVKRKIRARQRNGELAWPVESRTTYSENRCICYIVGLSKETMEIALIGDEKIYKWKDLLTGEVGCGRMVKIKPLDVKILELTTEIEMH